MGLPGKMFVVAGDGTRQVDDRLLTPRSAIGLGVILGVAVLFRVALVVQAPAFLAYRDSVQYFIAGYSLAMDGQLDLHFKRAPLYPIFLAGVIRVLGPSLETAAIVQHLLGLVTVVLVYLLGAVTFGRPTGLVAALGAALGGALLLTEHTIASEAVYTPLLVGSMLLVLLGLRTGRFSLFLAAGLALGCGALSRPTALAILPLAAGAVVVRPGTWRSRLLAAGLVCLGFLLITGPWTLRGQLVHGIPTTAGGIGEALFARVHRHDPSFDFHDYGQPELDPERAMIRERVFALAEDTRSGLDVQSVLQEDYQLSPSQADAFIRDAALQVIRQEPERYVRGTVEMFGQLWLGFKNPINKAWETRSQANWARPWPAHLRFVAEGGNQWPRENLARSKALTSVYDDRRFGPLFVPLFLLGTACCVARWRTWGLASILLPLVIFSQLLIYAALDGPLFRYRVPTQPLITLVVAAGLTYLVTYIARWRAWAWRSSGEVLSRSVRRARPSTGASSAPHHATSARSDSAVRRS